MRMNESMMECCSKFDGLKKLRWFSLFTHKFPVKLARASSEWWKTLVCRQMMERRKCFEGNQKKQRVFTVGLLPANWLVAELKDGDVGVSHTTQTLPQHLCPPSQPPPVSECQAVRRQDWWEGRQVLGGGRCYWSLVWSASFCQLQLWATLPAAACASFQLPTRSQPQPTARRCLESTTEETAAPPTGETVDDEGDWMKVELEGEKQGKVWGARQILWSEQSCLKLSCFSSRRSRRRRAGELSEKYLHFTLVLTSD